MNEGCDCCRILVCQLIINYQLIRTGSKRCGVKRNPNSQEMQPRIIVSAFGLDQMKSSTDVGETLGCGRDSGGQRRRRKGKKNSNINNEVKETVAAAAAVGRRRKQRRS